MNIEQANMTIVDYLNAYDRAEVIVNRDYQRSPARWPAAAQAFFIETIMRGFPIPRLALFTKTDLKARRTVKEIVDGQQRTHAIRAFFSNEVSLPRVLGASYSGRRFEDLGEEDQTSFLSYLLPIEVYVGATYADVREVFRRINSYTASLTPEEKRHARFQGSFKWFLHRFAMEHAQTLIDIGILTEHRVHRMEDVKLLAEVSHALLNGISTTSSRTLDKLYADHDEEFPEEDSLGANLQSGLQTILALPDIHDTVLMKPYQVYSLLLAAVHTRSPVDVLNEVYEVPTGRQPDVAQASESLLSLAAAIEDGGDRYPRLRPFIAASEGGTNVSGKRATRFEYFCQALLGELE